MFLLLVFCYDHRLTVNFKQSTRLVYKALKVVFEQAVYPAINTSFLR